jgi:hypothetical protein
VPCCRSPLFSIPEGPTIGVTGFGTPPVGLPVGVGGEGVGCVVWANTDVLKVITAKAKRVFLMSTPCSRNAYSRLILISSAAACSQPISGYTTLRPPPPACGWQADAAPFVAGPEEAAFGAAAFSDCPRLPRGRLRALKPLRRPRSRWRRGRH